MQSINEVFHQERRMFSAGGKPVISPMKNKLILLPLLLANLVLTGCFSAGLQFRESFTGRVTAGERVRNAALDVATLPVQVPVIAAIAIADAAD